MMTAPGGGVMQDVETISADEAFQAAARDVTELLSRVTDSDPYRDLVIETFGRVAASLRRAAELIQQH